MAKSLLLSVLVDVLGKYVEGLTNENLKLGVFSGKIEFHNLNLKDSALDELNLPIQVRKGALKHLRVKVPWTQLESKPVEINIDGVYLLAAPLDLSQCTPDVSRKMVYASKQKKLKEVDDAILLSLNKEKSTTDVPNSAKSASYLQQLATCILDNLEVTLTNVHVRYEDPNSDNGQVFCAGVTLDEVLLTTSDETWTAKFVKRDAARRAETAIRKIGKLNNCGIYWNSQAQSHLSMNQAEWEEVMAALIFKTNGGTRSDKVDEMTQYVLAPPNNLTLKITHREQCTESIPNVDMVIESSEMPFKVDKDQFRQFMLMLKSFGDLDRKRQMALYRPPLRPKQHVSAKEWWRYAYRLVTGRDFFLATKINTMKQCMRAKDKYIFYVKQNQVNAALAQAKGGLYKPQFEEEIRSIEETLPLVSLIIFREEAIKAAAAEIQRQSRLGTQEKAAMKSSSLQLHHPEEKKPEKKEAKKSFFSNWFSSSKSLSSTSPPISSQNSTPNTKIIDALSPKSALKQIANSEEEEDIALMGDIENRIHQLTEQSSAAINQMFSFRLSVTSSAKLELTYNHSPIVKLQMALAFGMEMRYGNMLLKFDMNNFSIEDICSINPYNKDLICMAPIHEVVSPSKVAKLTHSKRSQFELVLDLQQNKSILTIRALPLLVTWNKPCVQQILAFIIFATADDSYINSNRMLRNSMDRFAAEAALPKSDFFMKIDIDAPKVILPDDMGNTERCTIFDAGTLSLDGLLNANGMVWDIKLQRINIAMPFNRHSVRSTDMSTADDLYLVKPFDVSVKVQNTDQSSAELSVLAAVDPEIQAEFNAPKIIRLIQAITEIVSSIDTSKVESKTKKKKAPARRSSMITSSAAKPNETAPMPVTVAASKQNAASINKNVVNVLVTFLLDKLSLRLNFSENHFAELSFTGIQCKVSQRIFDQTVSFSVNSLMLTDSQRVEGFNHVILAQPDANDSNLADLFSLTLRTFSSKNSPLYEGNSMDLYVHISVINLFIDDQTTLGYKILIDELLTAYKLYFKGFDEEPVKLSITDSQDSNKTKKRAGSTPPNPLGGMLFDFAIERVSLHVLDTHINSNTVHNGTEIAFSVHMNVLRVNLLIHELLKGSALLHSIELVDVRSTTDSHVFRKLLGTDIFKYEDPDNVDKVVVPSAQEMLRIDFEQTSPTAMNIDFKAGHITVFIAVDVIVDLVAILMANVNALIEVIYAFSMDSRSKEVLDNFASNEGVNNVVAQVPNDVDPDERQEIFLRFTVDHPQLLLVEDPYSASSRAIVNKCKLNVMFRRVLKVATQEMEEVAHVAIEDSEIFVVGDLSVPDTIHRIVDPMSIEVHSSNRLEKGLMLEMKTAISSTNEISIRVSLNDILLATSIINRFGERKVISEPKDLDIEDKKNSHRLADSTSDAVKTGEIVQISKTDISVYNIKSTISRVQIILINDCNGQNNPLLRLEAAEADFAASGPLIGFFGDGSVALKMEYYNVPMNVWEPVMERWQPTMKLVKDFNGTDILLKYNNSVQINVTGTLLKCIMNAVSLISAASNQTDETGTSISTRRYSTRRTVPPLRISNQLGVDLELFDASKDKSLLMLVDSEMHPVPDSTAVSNFDFSYNSLDWNRPRMFFLIFKGELEGKIAPLRQLSTAALKKPKIYHLQPGSDVSPSGQASVAMTGRAIAPVTVDLYQYQRYNIVTQRWEAPWGQVGDPYEFADGLGKGKLNPAKVVLPANWQWVESDWKIDMVGEIGKEIDSEGWEYASNFSFFTLNNKRRTKLPTDLVRRRRWIRTRVYRAEYGDQGDINLLLGANVVWDVVAKPDESKEIYIRTSKTMVNELPVALEIGMGSTYNGATEPMTAVTVECGGRICIPLKCMNECVVRVRPAGLGFTWSEEIPIVLEKSRQEKVTDSKRVVCFSMDQIPVLLGTLAEEKDGLFTLTCSAMVHVVNRLPSNFSLGFRNLEEKYDQISLPAGDSCKLMNCNVGKELEITPSVGFYSRSEKVKLPGANEQLEAVLKLVDPRSARFILCTVRLSMNHQGVLTITVFSKMLVFDRTGLCASTSTATDRRDYQLESVTYHTEDMWLNSGIHSMNPSDYWIYGTHGMSIFQPVNDKLNIWVNKGRAQLNDIDTESLSSSKSKLELYDSTNNMQYSIAVQLQPYPAAPDICQVLHITSAFYIVNAMNDNEFIIKQANNEGEDFFVRPNQSRPWHACGKSADSTVLFVRTSHSDWSISTVNINDIGTSVVVLPRKNCGGPEGRDPVILNVDVRFSDPADPSYITVTIWESKMWRNPQTNKIHRLGTITFSIRNDSDEIVVARQHGVDVFRQLKRLGRLATDIEASKFELTIPSGQWLAYGWSDQDVDPKIEIYCGNNAFEKTAQTSKIALLDTNKVGQIVVLNNRIKIQVKTNPHGKYLHIEPVVPSKGDESETKKQQDSEVIANLRSNDLSLRIQLDGVAVSLIADRPKRREFFSAYLNGIHFALNQIFESEYENATTMMSFFLNGIQVDNYSQTVIYPVLLSTPSPALSKEKDDKRDDTETSTEMQFLEFSLVRESPKDQLMPIVKYVGFRMLEARIAIDSATILLYMSDLHRDLLEGASQIDSEEFSSIPLAESFNNSMVRLSKSSGMENTKKQYEQAQGDKIIIELLEIHPMKVVLNFSPSHYPRPTKEIPPVLRWMTKIETITAVEEFEVRIKSFIARDAMESVTTLTDRVLKKITNDLLSNLLGLTRNLVGSLNVLGKPAGLYKKVGSGIGDFFYEPYEGLMQSPVKFVKGVGKGTGKLIKGVGGGVVGSAATIVGTASGGVANVARNVVALSGDNKFIQRQEEKRREMKMNNGGALAGFKAAGESVFSGISSGLTGLVTAPLEEAKKSGPVGFFVGVGKGIVGAAVKPVAGVTEGISSMATGINQQFSNTVMLKHKRPPRAFFRPDITSTDLMLVPLDIYAAFAQEYVNKRAFKKNYSDSFLLALPTGFNQDKIKEDFPFGIVLSMKYVFVLGKNANPLWTMAVSTLSHVCLIRTESQHYGLQFVEYVQGKSSENPSVVAFAHRGLAVAAYDHFVRYRSLFGYPSLMEPSELVLSLIEGGGSATASVGSDHHAPHQLQRTASSHSVISSMAPSPHGSVQSDSNHGGASLSSGNNSTGSNAQSSTSNVQPIIQGRGHQREYAFGTANGTKYDNQRMSDQQFRMIAERYFSKIHIQLPIPDESRSDYHHYLDHIVWRTVSDWNYNHDFLINPSRCCACLVINHSKSFVQVLDIELKEGVQVLTFGIGEGYDPNGRIIKPDGGAAVLFGFGRRPSFTSKEHVKYIVHSNAFTSMVSTRENSSNLNSTPGFNSTFMEKSRTDWWGKFVIIVR